MSLFENNININNYTTACWYTRSFIIGYPLSWFGHLWSEWLKDTL